MNRSVRIVATVLAVGLCIVPAVPVLGAARDRRPAADPELQKVLARFDQVQNSIRSLSSDFTKTTESPLVRDPLVARGRVYLSKPNSVLWEFTTPEPMRFLISNDEYTGYFPERKQAERRDIHRWSETIFRFLGLGQASSELQKFYDISLGDPGQNMKGTYLLQLEPKKRRVRRKVDTVQLWVDSGTQLPVQLAYHSGDTLETISFRDMRVNPDLSAQLFTMPIPSGVTVTNGFSGLGAGPELQGR